MIFNA